MQTKFVPFQNVFQLYNGQKVKYLHRECGKNPIEYNGKVFKSSITVFITLERDNVFSYIDGRFRSSSNLSFRILNPNRLIVECE